MITPTIRQIYVNDIVKDLLGGQDFTSSSTGEYSKNCRILALLHKAILNTEEYTVEEWIDLFYGLKKISALRPHIDLIVNLRKVEENSKTNKKSIAH